MPWERRYFWGVHDIPRVFMDFHTNVHGLSCQRYNSVMRFHGIAAKGLPGSDCHFHENILWVSVIGGIMALAWDCNQSAVSCRVVL